MTENDAIPEGSPPAPGTSAHGDNEHAADSDADEEASYEPLEASYAALDESDDEADGEVSEEGQADSHVATPLLPEPLTIRLEDNIKMSAEDAATISSVMASIKLPESAIPGWAHQIPESAWLPRLASSEQNTDSTDR
ncbi:hypothetical protein HDU87_008569 [Geranomyces variabilis]|uniref:Uncharacterized protein n=1 Tax=Geranomyces variabilis TaxID=109894 RepID=A0AAD5XQ06_9FUNG|nr:hypothetical protein HDU87_008569 [Geranomyces variabilis]